MRCITKRIFNLLITEIFSLKSIFFVENRNIYIELHVWSLQMYK